MNRTWTGEPNAGPTKILRGGVAGRGPVVVRSSLKSSTTIFEGGLLAERRFDEGKTHAWMDEIMANREIVVPFFIDDDLFLISLVEVMERSGMMMESMMECRSSQGQKNQRKRMRAPFEDVRMKFGEGKVRSDADIAAPS